MKKQNVVLVLAGAALIAGFFLDWMFGKSGLDFAQAERFGWSRYLFFMIPLFGAGTVAAALSGHKFRVGVGILAGVVSLGLTIYLWSKALPTDRLEFWIIVASAVGAIYLVATKAESQLLALPGGVIVAAYFVPTITVPFVLMVLGAALLIAGLTKHRTGDGLAIALPIVVVAPLVQQVALGFRYRAELGMWIILVASLAVVGAAIASASRTKTE